MTLFKPINLASCSHLIFDNLVARRNFPMKRKLIFALAALPALILLATPSRFAQHQAPSAARSRGRALLVGVNEYQTKGINPTPGSIEDAMAIGKLIQEKGWFNATEVKTLLGPQATSANIEREFRQWLIGGT